MRKISQTFPKIVGQALNSRQDCNTKIKASSSAEVFAEARCYLFDMAGNTSSETDFNCFLSLAFKAKMYSSNACVNFLFCKLSQ